MHLFVSFHQPELFVKMKKTQCEIKNLKANTFLFKLDPQHTKFISTRREQYIKNDVL